MSTIQAKFSSSKNFHCRPPIPQRSISTISESRPSVPGKPLAATMAAVKQQQLQQMQLQQQQQNVKTALPNFNLNREDMSESLQLLTEISSFLRITSGWKVKLDLGARKISLWNSTLSQWPSYINECIVLITWSSIFGLAGLDIQPMAGWAQKWIWNQSLTSMTNIGSWPIRSIEEPFPSGCGAGLWYSLPVLLGAMAI